ncbi:2-dehydropantoate 2-reductase [Marinobacter santoriniensis NKSG1]|uniref:2-dehydropantoate 2-reductase n=1 Tax=Marinobacter santoriniensis NKSG1 TaxID=1288826 RepID=M7CSB2_9GAMM|nr:ketopantoate reductase family protein [Marinobacter santoriniensis]EMP56501.1 2-dehydropantoate 2-reductase [Marinobacter santoriniensis NKSG1]
MIGVLGAGSLGRLWAALLPGDQIGYLPRPEASLSGQVLTYTFESIGGEERPIRLPPTTPEAISVLLVTTKAGDTFTALQGCISAIPAQTPIVLFQNGLGSQQSVAEAWPSRPILAASTTEGANRPTQERVIHAGLGETWLGPLTGSGSARVGSVIQVLNQTGLVLHAEENILTRLWDKLIVNAGINPFTAILDCPNGDLPESAFFQQHIGDLCREMAILVAADTDRHPSPEALQERIRDVVTKTARNTSSMRADVMRGKPTEIDFINGYLVSLGKKLGIPTPVNQLLTEQVKQLSPHSE